MTQPVRRLEPGQRVAVIAPSGPVPREPFQAGLEVLRARYSVTLDEGLFSRDGFLAGPDPRRLGELLQYLRDPEVGALFCARGGYGAARLLPDLGEAASALAASPRPLVGFSDITTLLVWALADAQVRPIHGPVVTQLATLTTEDLHHLWALLEDPAPPPPIIALRPLVPGCATGPLLGGNLEVLTRLIGTRWQPRLAGSILLVEEIGERPYRIDRMLTQLRLTGLLDGVAGILLGDLVRCEEPETAWPGLPSPAAEAVFAERLGDLGIPVAAGAPIGHGSRNRAVPLGAQVTLDVDGGMLRFHDGAVV